MLLSDWHSLEEPEVASLAASLARQGLLLDPKNVELHLCLADSIVALAEMTEEPVAREKYWREAIEAGERGLQIAPREVRFVLTIAGACDALGLFDQAESYFQRALALDPNSVSVLMNFGAHFHLLKKFDEAEVLYKKAFECSYSATAGLNIQRLEKDRKAAATDH